MLATPEAARARPRRIDLGAQQLPVNTIILDSQARKVFIRYNGEGTGEIYDGCTFSNLSVLAATTNEAPDTGTADGAVLATCYAGDPTQETFATIELVAKLNENHEVEALTRAATEYRGALTFNVTNSTFVPARGGDGDNYAFDGSGRVEAGPRGGGSSREINGILLSTKARKVILRWARTDGDGQAYENCRFTNLDVLSTSQPASP